MSIMAIRAVTAMFTAIVLAFYMEFLTPEESGDSHEQGAEE